MNRILIFLSLVWRDHGYGFRWGIGLSWEVAGTLQEFFDDEPDWMTPDEFEAWQQALEAGV